MHTLDTVVRIATLVVCILIVIVCAGMIVDITWTSRKKK